MARNKYGNRKTSLFGIVFDSKAEAWRYPQLLERVENGEISDLRLQPKYELQRAFKNSSGKKVPAIVYIPDYDYIENGKRVAEDVKGHATATFKLKQKLFWFNYPDVELRIISA